MLYWNLRYNLLVKFRHISYSLANTVRQFLRCVSDGVATESESSPLEPRLSDGCELMGEYNFRTSKLDRGSDPIGWYEEDV